MKKHGNEYSKAEDEDKKAETDFYTAADLAGEMLEEFSARNLQTGPAISGALTQLISQLLVVSPDTPAAIGLLSSCMTNAAAHAHDALYPDVDGGPVH